MIQIGLVILAIVAVVFAGLFIAAAMEPVADDFDPHDAPLIQDHP